MELDHVLTLIREGLHFGTALVLLSYQPNGARHRYGVSFLAMIMAASNLALGVALLTSAIEPRSMGGQWLHIGAFGSLFCLILMCRGNVAKMIPNRSHGAR
ncbi:phage holin family protein [Pseudomonas tolaasii]